MLDNDIFNDLPHIQARRTDRAYWDAPGSARRAARLPRVQDAALPELGHATRAQGYGRAALHVSRVVSAARVLRAACLGYSVSEAAARFRWPDIDGRLCLGVWAVRRGGAQVLTVARTGAAVLECGAVDEALFLGCAVFDAPTAAATFTPAGRLLSLFGSAAPAEDLLMLVGLEFASSTQVECAALRRFARVAAYAEGGNA